MRPLAITALAATLVSCDRPADPNSGKLSELEQRAAAAEARNLELEQEQRDMQLAAERDSIKRERALIEQERYELARTQKAADAAAEQRLRERELTLAAREGKVERMQDDLEQNLGQLEDLSRDLTEREREIAGREALATAGQDEPPAEPAGDYGMFHDSLASHGSWFETPDYGYVWQPAVVRDVSWRPYTRGRWVCTDHGWTWISDEPFGWATYHYGRWALIQGRGWIWVPGSEWAPAWVSWRYGDTHVGWAPLPPESLAYRHWAWDANVEATLGLGASWFCFVETRHFGGPIRDHCLPYQRNAYFHGQTRNITRIGYVNHRVINGGPSYGDVSRKLGRPVPFYRLEMDRHGSPHRKAGDSGPRIANGRLQVHAPNLDVAWNDKLRPKSVRGTWSDVAIQRDQPLDKKVREKFLKDREERRRGADEAVRRLGGPERFPERRREELAGMNRRKEESKPSSGTGVRRDSKPDAKPHAKPDALPQPAKKPAETRVSEPVRKQTPEGPKIHPRRDEPRNAVPDRKPVPTQDAETKRREDAKRELQEVIRRSAETREKDRQEKLEHARKEQTGNARREQEQARIQRLQTQAEAHQRQAENQQRQAETQRRQIEETTRRDQAAGQQRAMEETRRRQQEPPQPSRTEPAPAPQQETIRPQPQQTQQPSRPERQESNRQNQSQNQRYDETRRESRGR